MSSMHESIILKQITPYLRAIARKYSRAGSAFEDLYQEASIAALLAIREYQPGPRSVKRYAYSAALNCCRTLIRNERGSAASAKRNPHISLDAPIPETDFTYHDVIGVEPDQEMLLLQKEEAQLPPSVRMSRRTELTPIERRVMECRTRPNRPTLRELAEELGLSRSRLQQLEKSALKKLKMSYAA